MCGIEITPSKDGRLSRDCLKRGDYPVIVSIITDSYSSRHSGCPLTHSSVCESLLFCCCNLPWQGSVKHGRNVEFEQLSHHWILSQFKFCSSNVMPSFINHQFPLSKPNKTLIDYHRETNHNCRKWNARMIMMNRLNDVRDKLRYLFTNIIRHK